MVQDIKTFVKNFNLPVSEINPREYQMTFFEEKNLFAAGIIFQIFVSYDKSLLQEIIDSLRLYAVIVNYG